MSTIEHHYSGTEGENRTIFYIGSDPELTTLFSLLFNLVKCAETAGFKTKQVSR